MLATTITLSESTRSRLAMYKRGDMTFDDVIKALMQRVPVEEMAAEQIAEHYHRLETFKGIPADEFQTWLKARIKARARRGRR